jgi:hypothetical protein
MSGQLLMQPADAEDELHLRVRSRFTDGGPSCGSSTSARSAACPVSEGGAELPAEIAHIARDPMDPLFEHRACTLVVETLDLLEQAAVPGTTTGSSTRSPSRTSRSTGPGPPSWATAAIPRPCASPSTRKWCTASLPTGAS